MPVPQIALSLADFLNPAVLPGALVYAVVFLLLASLIAWLVHLVIQRSMKRASDPTGFRFVDQLIQVLVFITMIILYAQLVPPLRSLGTALLASVSIASIVIGLAAQSTLGNLVAGFALLLYRPFHIGDRVQLNTPKGVMTAKIESLTLGYTFLRDDEENQVIVPNSVMASVVIIRNNTKES
jgi:small-conductance mechanosensitive channel